ncbi:SRPBCC domain-containing protein [Mangrovimonas sp. TPBH4]|uniref:SRPBCC family protein n=1 Tax=Mangrovimonas sp. TPBH4 TaxID=1645914 RepID=UPI0006B54AB9|nr:SRPBCC domain-containing protein [Mangrovimonas sp. TPBH4]
MKRSDPPIIIIQEFEVPVAQVWKAITEHKQMLQWFFENIPEFKAEKGFHTQFNVKAPSRDFLHLWTIEEVLPNKKLVYRWRYQDLDGDSYVTFELIPIDVSKTQLILSVTIIEDFQEGIPEFSRESCLEGWQYFINESLKAYLDK